MARPMLCSPVLSDAGALAASDAASSTLGVANLQNFNPRKYWQSSTLTPYLVENLGAAYGIRLISLLYTNFQASDTVRVRAATSEANLTAAPGYDSGAVSAWPGGADLSTWDRPFTRLYLPAAETYQWWRIDLDVSANSDGHARAARLYLSEGFQPEVGILASALWTPTFVERAPRTVSHSGTVTPRSFPGKRHVEAPLGMLTKDEAFGGISVLMRQRGSSGDVLLLIDPEEETYPMDEMYYGFLNAERPVPNTYAAAGGTPRFSVNLQIEEP